jgi:two-component system chemotaxis response regulator CheB
VEISGRDQCRAVLNRLARPGLTDRQLGDSVQPVHSVRPAADVLLSSVARAYGGSTVAVVLTGMGHDGAAGATEIKQAGGHVIVQDEPTSVIYGMAASVVEAGSADVIAPLPHIAVRIVQACGLT